MVADFAEQYHKEVLAGFAKVSIEQALRGDREMFTLMAQEVSGSLRAMPIQGICPWTRR